MITTKTLEGFYYSVNRELVDDTNDILYDKDKRNKYKSSRIGESLKL